MSHLIVAPPMMMKAAEDLKIIGSDLSTAHAAAAMRTVAVAPAAADEVSAGIAHLFSQYAEGYHALAEKAAAFQAQFVRSLDAARGAYLTAEEANASLLQVGPAAVVHEPPIDVPPPTPSLIRSPVEVFFDMWRNTIESLLLQQMMGRYNLFLTLVSNVLKTMSDTMGSIVQNLR
ncbi:PE family protein [Mycobacterium bourgelatii]|uniref:PE domain-containing protein n=1 Tax=Mycobacterium bourgelatii TaxID=1273442 RepID=A0A7I9YKH9_MYCBU|nr:PE family protein [Mycobacterium bourgelatii]MCV6974585.1 PE domain-containing protein [Mycobacterium bourgelatii]GFG89052.1 hypothetical protein MBOU_10940 [Mycobacterium bourgelatii]